MSQVKGTVKDFSCSMQTVASTAVFWHLWTDVDGWAAWDTPLRSASLDGDMRLGATGTLTTKGGQSSQFTITEFEPQQSYAFTTALPGALLVVRRYFSEADEFTHHVTFRGFLAPVFARLLGRGFRRDLPPVMENLKRLAEADRSKNATL